MREPQVGGLHLPKDVGVGQSDAKRVQAQWDTHEKVKEQLKKWGMPELKEPDCECPEVTAEELNNPDLKRFTVVYGSQLRWYNYATRVLAGIRATLLPLENEMSDIETKQRLNFRRLDEGKKDKDKMSVTEMKDHIFQDPHYKSLNLTKQELDQQRIHVEAWVESLDRNLRTVSRQIENRKTESEGGNRENNMPRHASGGWGSRGLRGSGE